MIATIVPSYTQTDIDKACQELFYEWKRQNSWYEQSISANVQRTFILSQYSPGDRGVVVGIVRTQDNDVIRDMATAQYWNVRELTEDEIVYFDIMSGIEGFVQMAVAFGVV